MGISGLVFERIDRKRCFIRKNRVTASLAKPDWKRYTVETLARNVPVVAETLDPFIEPHAHPVGKPSQRSTPCRQIVFEIEHTDEPLRRHHEFDRRAGSFG